MATLYTVLAALQEQISAVTTGLISISPDIAGQPINVMVGIGFPSERTLQNNVRKVPPTAIVTIYDRGLARDTTRWLPQRAGYVSNPVGITATLSAPVIAHGSPAVLTLTGTPNVGDGVGLGGVAIKNEPIGVVATARQDDTAATLAASLAAAVNADPNMSAVLKATAAGDAVTLAVNASQTVPSRLVRLAANVGNGAIEVMEVGRRDRGLQIVVWTRTEDDQNVIGDVIEIAIARMQMDFGLTFPDGTMGRLLFGGDHLLPNATLADTYRRDFLVSVDYPITVPRQLYAVLATIIQQSQF